MNSNEPLPITRCPHCGATFNVRPDQLVARQGYVRCGSCRGVFHAPQNYLVKVTPPEPSFEVPDDPSNPPTIMPAMLTQRATVGNQPGVSVGEAVRAVAVTESIATRTDARETGPALTKEPVQAPVVAQPSTAKVPSLTLEAPAPSLEASSALTQFPARSAIPASVALIPEIRDGAAPTKSDEKRPTGSAPNPSGSDSSKPQSVVASPPSKPRLDPDRDRASTVEKPLPAPAASEGKPRSADVPAAAKETKPKSAAQRPPAITQKDAIASKETRRTDVLEGPSEIGRTAQIMDKWFELDTEELETRIENTKMRLAKGGRKVNTLEAELQTKMRATTEDQMPSEGALRTQIKGSKTPVHEFEWRPNKTSSAPSHAKARVAWSIAAGVAALGLLAQAATLFRHELSLWVPPAKPLLVRLCDTVGCHIRVPRRLGALALVGSDLVADPAHKGLYTFTSTLRNTQTEPVDFPSIVLALNGLNDTVLARKLISPKAYVPGHFDISRGLPGLGEVEFKIFLDASTTAPVGYSARPTYTPDDALAPQAVSAQGS